DQAQTGCDQRRWLRGCRRRRHLHSSGRRSASGQTAASMANGRQCSPRWTQVPSDTLKLNESKAIYVATTNRFPHRELHPRSPRFFSLQPENGLAGVKEEMRTHSLPPSSSPTPSTNKSPERTALDRSVQVEIGRLLRDAYSEVTLEPVPE